MEIQNLIERRKAIKELTGDQMSAELVAVREQAVDLLKDEIELKDRAQPLAPTRVWPCPTRFR